MKKKMVVFVTLISLLFTLGTAASAEEASQPVFSMKTYGEILFDLGLLKGSGNGLNEEGYLNRAEMITILNRLSIKDSSSFIAPDKPTFTDVPKNHWAYHEVEKAYYNKLTTGVSKDKFGVDDKVTYQQAVTFLLRAAGYTIDYNKALEEGFEYGVYLTEDKTASENLYRGDVFELMLGALYTFVSGTEDYLIDLLPIEPDKYDALMNAENLMPYNPVSKTFVYEAPEAYKGTDEYNKEVSQKEQSIYKEIKKVLDLYKGYGESRTFDELFKLAQKDGIIPFTFSFAHYHSEDDYGIYGSIAGDIDESGYLYAYADASEGYAEFTAIDPIVEYYGSVKADGRDVELYYVLMFDEYDDTFYQLFFLIDSQGVYKMVSLGGYGSGVYTR